MNRWTRCGVLALAGTAALVAVAAASAHAIVSPPVALAKQLQVFTLSVPTEEEGQTTTKVELTVPKGFTIDSFLPAPPGWTRHTSGNTITWSGGKTPTEVDSAFSFNASTSGASTYTFGVQQTYSSGKVVEWNGAESSDTPAPTVKTVSSFGGGGTSILAIVGVALGALALVLALAGLLARGRELA
jgi:uncharacterized protein YcnI